MATVVARLIIKPHHYKAGTTRTFTCVGRSGAKVVKASSKSKNAIKFAELQIYNNFYSLPIQQPFISTMKPRILVSLAMECSKPSWALKRPKFMSFTRASSKRSAAVWFFHAKRPQKLTCTGSVMPESKLAARNQGTVENWRIFTDLWK